MKSLWHSLFERLTAADFQGPETQAPSGFDRTLAACARLLAAPYGWGAKARRALYAGGWLKARGLPAPVVSVGNPTVGGTGKTPMVAHLAAGLTGRGVKVAILSRGYGGQATGVLKIADGEKLYARPPQAGEEPYWLARHLPGVAVYTGADRYAAGLAAWAEVRPELFLLDDGFQHFQLHRDLDIVLLDAAQPFGNGRTLPAGPLREPAASLAAADVIILTRFPGGSPANLLWRLREEYPAATLLTADIRPTAARRFPEGRRRDLREMQGLALLGFCGLARPRVFQDTLAELGVELRGFFAFPDHYAFTPQDLSDLRRQANEAGAQGLITTAKDFARLGEAWEGDLPLWVVDVGVELPQDQETQLFAMILALSNQPGASPRRAIQEHSAEPAPGPHIQAKAAKEPEAPAAPASHRWEAAEPRPLPAAALARLQSLKVWPSRRPFARPLRRILVLAPNWVGDAIMSLPVLPELQRLVPDAAVTLAARRSVAPVFQEQPEVAEVLVMPTGWPRWAWFRSLKPPFDLGVALPNSLAAAAGLWLAGSRERLGYAADGRSLLLTRAVTGRKRLKGVHQVYYYLGLLTALGPVNDFTPPRLVLSQAEQDAARRFLAEQGLKPGQPLVGLGPGAAYGPAKRWPPERFAAVAAALQQEYGAAVALLGGPEDREAAALVMRQNNDNLLDFVGKTGLRQALALLAQMRLFITNDSGLMHAAAALGTPLVALFGSTDPTATGPFSDRAVVLRHPLPCSPCLKRTCETGYPCLTAITVAEVVDAARPWLKENLS